LTSVVGQSKRRAPDAPNSDKYSPAVAWQKALKIQTSILFSRSEDQKKFALLNTFLNARKRLQLMQQDINLQSLLSSERWGGEVGDFVTSGAGTIL